MFPNLSPDLFPALVPAAARKAMLDQGRRVLSAQGELVSWQLGRLEAAEEQALAFWKLSLDQTRKAVDNAIAMQEQALSVLAPKEDEAASA